MTAPIIIGTAPGWREDPDVERLVSLTKFKGLAVQEIIDAVISFWKTAYIGPRHGAAHSPLEMEGFDNVQREMVVDISRTRKKAAEKYPDGDALFFTSEGLRWGTPSSAADHCAERLGRQLVMDITCGQGGQVLSLSRTSEHVIAVDIEPINCLITLMNCISRGIENVTIVNADCFDDRVISQSSAGCAVFSDPARPPGSEERTFDEIVPDPRRVIEAYGDVSSGMCFEVPPYLSMEKVDFTCEAEFVSLDGRLNRLNLYTGDLVRSERSAVILPNGSEIRGSPDPEPAAATLISSKDKFAYEMDPAVVRSGLTSAFLERSRIEGTPIHLDDRRSLLITGDKIDSPFLKQGYRVLETSVEEGNLKKALKKLGAGSVTLRYQLDPRDYWGVRKELEKELTGTRKVQLFRPRDYLILEKLGG